MSSLFDFENKTDRYTVMGNPINHSKSPRIHTLFAQQTGQNIKYTATQVDPGGFEQAVGNFHASGGKGLNITVPFKQEAWRLANERSTRAEIAGAVNTILFKSGNILYGDNSDGIGLVKDIRDNHEVTFDNKRILILGAGGAVRGVLLPILEENPKIIVVANRTTGKAKELANIYSNKGNITGNSYQEIDKLQFDLIINGTSASLHGQLPPLPDNILAENACCYDMMYAKTPSLFLQWALKQNATKVIDGLGMLVEQAAESFYLWREKRPNTADVIAKLRNEL